MAVVLSVTGAFGRLGYISGLVAVRRSKLFFHFLPHLLLLQRILPAAQPPAAFRQLVKVL